MTQSTVYLGESDPMEARCKAERIYDHLGPSFFDMSVNDPTPERVVVWLTYTLMYNDLRVDFDDANDAMLFKLMFA